MTDRLTPEHRSWNMGRIRGKNTKPEIIVRSILHRMGYRFRIDRRDLPGRPDLVLPKYHAALFVHGCFWHRHTGCSNASTPKTRQSFWKKKFEENVSRDNKNTQLLKDAGWKVIVVWECEVKKDPHALSRRLDEALGKRWSDTDSYSIPNRNELFKAAEKRSDYVTFSRAKPKTIKNE